MTSAERKPSVRAAPLDSFTIGRYEVLALLATGGMAEVFLAKLRGAQGFERAVVLKRVLPHLARQSQFRTMFLDEARVVAAIAHPNVTQVHELGEEGDDLFLVMEYVAGESLSTVLKKLSSVGERMPPHVVAFIGTQAAAGLHAAHELTGDEGQPLDVVHRDVSPHNLMITYDGQVKVLDFGIAKSDDASHHTESGVLKGKFAYMAPEQYQGDPVDRRTDIFALGTVLWESLLNRRLFARSNEVETLRAICEDAIPPPSEFAEIPEPLEAACMKALARAKEDRFQTAKDLRRALETAAREAAPDAFPQEELKALMERHFARRKADKREMLRKVRSGTELTHVPNVDPTSPTQAAKPPPKRWLRWASAGLLALGLLVGVAAALWESGEPPAAPAIEAPPETEVQVRIRSRPEGAEVMFGDRSLGPTPVETQVPAGDEPVVVRFTLSGHAPLEERVVPDGDVRLTVALVPEAAPTMEPTTAETSMEEPAEASEMATEASEMTSTRRRRTRRRRAPTEMSSPEYFRFD